MQTIPPVSRLVARTLAMTLLAIIALCASVAAMAGPILTAAAYPASAVQPDTVQLLVGTAAPVACELRDTPAGKEPRCDLAGVPIGSHTILLRACVADKITTQPGGATLVQGGCADSAPFAYTRAASGVAAPSGLGLVAQ